MVIYDNLGLGLEIYKRQHQQALTNTINIQVVWEQETSGFASALSTQNISLVQLSLDKVFTLYA